MLVQQVGVSCLCWIEKIKLANYVADNTILGNSFVHEIVFNHCRAVIYDFKNL